jgi:hypothetical protein
VVNWFWAPTPTSCIRPPGILLLLLDPENVYARNNDRVRYPCITCRDRFATHVYVSSIRIRLDWNDSPSGIASATPRRCVGNGSLSDSGDPLYGSVWYVYESSSNEAQHILSLKRFGGNHCRAFVSRWCRHGTVVRRTASEQSIPCRLCRCVLGLVELILIASRIRCIDCDHQLTLLLGQIPRGLEFRKVTLCDQLPFLRRQDIACRQRIRAIHSTRTADCPRACSIARGHSSCLNRRLFTPKHREISKCLFDSCSFQRTRSR